MSSLTIIVEKLAHRRRGIVTKPQLHFFFFFLNRLDRASFRPNRNLWEGVTAQERLLGTSCVLSDSCSDDVLVEINLIIQVHKTCDFCPKPERGIGYYSYAANNTVHRGRRPDLGGLESSRDRSNTSTEPAEPSQVCSRRSCVKEEECGLRDTYVVVENDAFQKKSRS